MSWPGPTKVVFHACGCAEKSFLLRGRWYGPVTWQFCHSRALTILIPRAAIVRRMA